MKEAEKSIVENKLLKSSMSFFEKDRKKVEQFSVFAIFSLIAAIILISFNQKLIAGCVVIVATSLGIIAFRTAISEGESHEP